MESIASTVKRLFAAIAVVVAILLCGLLIGCGSGQDIVHDTGGGECVVPPATGFYIKGETEEHEECDIDDDMSISIIYGIDLDIFGVYYDEAVEIDGLYITAYDREAYRRENMNAQSTLIDYEGLYDAFSALEVGGANNGAFLIEGIPYTVESRTLESRQNKTYKYVNLDFLKDTDYECTKSYDPFKIICYKKINVKLPRELFASDSGRVYINLSVLAYNDTDKVLASLDGLAEKPIIFDYAIEGEKVVISYVSLGSNTVVEGERSAVGAKTKSLSNAKPI